MMCRVIITAWLFLCAVSVPAQEQNGSLRKARFYSVIQAGWLRGEAGGAFTVQNVQGVRLGGWSSGIGVGLDQYAMRSVPLFLQVQKQLPLFDKSFSVYLDGGFNLPWKEEVLDGLSQREQKGLYLEAGLQYHWRIRNNFGPVFSFGYSEKRYSFEQSGDVWCVAGPCTDYRNTWMLTNRRIALKAGIRL